MCVGGYEGYDEFKSELFDESCIARHRQKFHDLSQRLWEKAVLDDSESSRLHHQYYSSDVTSQNDPPHKKFVDVQERIVDGDIEFILTTDAHNNMTLSVSSILKRLCTLVADDPQEVGANDKNFADIDGKDSSPYLDLNRIKFKILREPYIEYSNMDKILTDLFPFIFYRGFNRNPVKFMLNPPPPWHFRTHLN